jgi:hypothetical protein
VFAVSRVVEGENYWADWIILDCTRNWYLYLLVGKQPVNPLDFALNFIFVGVHSLYIDLFNVRDAAVCDVDQDVDHIWSKIL